MSSREQDNWFAPYHLSTRRDALAGYDWAFSYRVFVNPVTAEPVCPDTWESIGPGRGIFKTKANGFADPNTLMLDKMKCHNVLPYWAVGPFEGGRGSDRVVFDRLQARHSWHGTGKVTAFYTFSEADELHGTRLEAFRQQGIARTPDTSGRPRYVRTSAD